MPPLPLPAHTLPSLIDFAKGYPDARELPVQLLQSAANHLFHDTSADRMTRWLQYGADPGDADFRIALSQFLSKTFGAASPIPMAITQENLFLTTGVSHSVDMIASLLIKPHSTVIVDAVTYYLVLPIFHQFAIKLLPMPMLPAVADNHPRLDLSALRRLCDSERPSACYIIPASHNPTGVTMISDDRMALIQVAVEFDMIIIADEVYQLLNFPDANRQPQLPFALLAYQAVADHFYPNALSSVPQHASSSRSASQLIFSVSSFSKILCPGTRLGWIHTDPQTVRLLAQHAATRSGGCMSHYSCAHIYQLLIKENLHLLLSYIQKLTVIYQSRCLALMTAINLYIPTAKYIQPFGGYFIYITLPTSIDTMELLPFAVKEGCTYRAAPTCSLLMKDDGPRFPAFAHLPARQVMSDDLMKSLPETRHSLRLCFAYHNEDELTVGVQRLAQAISAYVSTRNK